MPQKFAFTTVAMAAALEDTPITYEDLAEIEKDFDDAETEISAFTSFPNPPLHQPMRLKISANLIL